MYIYMYNVYVYIYTVMLINVSPKEAGYSKTPNKPSSTGDFGPRWSSNGQPKVDITLWF